MYKRLSRIAFFAVAIISVICVLQLPKLEFNYEFDSYYPQQDPDLEFLDKYHKHFGHDSKFLLIGIENREGIFQQDFLQKVHYLATTLKKVDKNVVKVISPTELKQEIIGPMGPLRIPYLHINNPGKYASDSTRIYGNANLTGTFFAPDARSVTLMIFHPDEFTQREANILTYKIKGLIASMEFDSVHMVGRMIAQGVYIDKLKDELVLFVGTSLVLIILFLFFAFRTWWGVVVPVVIVILAIVWILGFMEMTGKSIDLMMTLLPTIMFVVGMSDVVHVISKYLEELRGGKHKINALKVAFREVGLATFLTSLTTAIGFITLVTSSVHPIREFGIYTAIGVFIAFFLTFSLLPSVLLNMKKPSIARKPPATIFWNRKLPLLFLWVMRHPKQIITGWIVVILISFYGLSQIRVNSYLLEDLSAEDKMKKDAIFFERNFDGIRPFEMAVFVNDSSKTMYSYEVLQEIGKIENYLSKVYEVGAIASPLTPVKFLNQAMHHGKYDFFNLPVSERKYNRIKTQLSKYRNTEEMRSVISKRGHLGRISGKINDLGSHEIEIRNLALAAFMRENINHDLIGYRLTGSALLVDKNNSNLSISMLTGLGIAFIVIAIITGLLYRSWRIVILALIPNMIPLLMIAGIMGLFGIDVKVSTSIVFTIAFGIAVDDTIHFMSKLKLELEKGKSLLYGLKRTYLSTGKAIVLTTLILCAGFLTLIFSDFKGTFYVGLLIGLSLFFAVLADLLLLPVLLKWFYRPKAIEGS